jgi:hypothetical protein
MITAGKLIDLEAGHSLRTWTEFLAIGLIEQAAHGLLSFDDQSARLVKQDRRSCAALAGKRTSAADTMGGGNAQRPAIRRRFGEW